MVERLIATHAGDALHAATAIALIPRDDMDVGVKDLLPCGLAIIDAEIEAVRS